jgi:hypothetical protein
MFPFPYTGLRLVHDEKVCDAMERARIDAELARNSRRTLQLSMLRSLLIFLAHRAVPCDDPFAIIGETKSVRCPFSLSSHEPPLLCTS